MPIGAGCYLKNGYKFLNYKTQVKGMKR